MRSFEEAKFRAQVDNALSIVRKVLDTNKTPKLPENVNHKYEDKYLLAEFLTNSAFASSINCFELLGLNDKGLKKLLQWAEKSAVTLRFKSEEKCTFLREEEKKISSPVEYVKEMFFGLSKTTVTDKRITTVIEYYWKYELEYEIYFYKGTSPDDGKLSLQGRKVNCELMTNAKVAPRPESTVNPPYEANISYILNAIKENGNVFDFEINKNDKDCHTPRRNPSIENAARYFKRIYDWANDIEKYFKNQVFPLSNSGLDLSKMNDNNILVPVIPLFEEKSSSTPKDEKKKNKSLVTVSPSAGGAPLLQTSDLMDFLDEEKRSVNERFSEMSKMFKEKGLVSEVEAKLIVLLMHIKNLCQNYSDGIEYIEEMLYKQLVQAIGKVVTPVDFSNYMRYHNRQMFKEEYQPSLFSYAVRRVGHYPEGVLSIEAQLDDGSLADPLPTICRSAQATRPMFFSLNAATKVSFGGDRHLHALLNHQFSGSTGSQLNLIARARQFSSFILLVGRIVSADLFEPKFATIIQNKDDLRIPLMMETIPTPKEFRDAIESLSPEQQRFAKAYRSMQLSSTLFGVCVIQIKPQLEKLLNIPYDSLTKEIKLTQDLMELFIKYQIPSDQLSFDGKPSLSDDSKLSTVKRHVKAMQDMIAQAQQKEIQQSNAQYQYNNPIPLSSPKPTNTLFRHKSPVLSSAIQSESYKKSDTSNLSMLSFGSAAPGGKSSPAPPPPTSFSFSAAPPPPRGQSAPPPPSPSPSVQSVPLPPAPSVPSVPLVPSVPSVPSAPSAPSEPASQSIEIPSTKSNTLSSTDSESEDYTKIPALLDSKYDALDVDSALRPTIINVGDKWTKNCQKALLAPPTTEYLHTKEQGQERNKAIDLLDALTRSGAISLDWASLHVVIAATHCFDKTLMYTVIQDNINPIEKLERSTLIMASTIHNKPPSELINEEHLSRVSTYSPELFESSQMAIDDKEKVEEKPKKLKLASKENPTKTKEDE